MPGRLPQNVDFLNAREDGSEKMAVDGSVNACHFDIDRPEGPLLVGRCVFSIVDVGMNATTFGGLPRLLNGLLVRVVDRNDAVIKDFLDGRAIRENSEWTLLAGVDAPIPLEPPGMKVAFPIRWSLFHGLGGIPLHLSAGNKLRFTVQDDLTGLTSFSVAAHCHHED